MSVPDKGEPDRFHLSPRSHSSRCSNRKSSETTHKADSIVLKRSPLSRSSVFLSFERFFERLDIKSLVPTIRIERNGFVPPFYPSILPHHGTERHESIIVSLKTCETKPSLVIRTFDLRALSSNIQNRISNLPTVTS